MSDNRMAHSLRYQWLSTFLGSMLILSLTMAFVSWWAADRWSRWQSEQRLRSISQMVANPSYPLSIPVLKSMASLTQAKLVLVDPKGRILAASESALTDRVVDEVRMFDDPTADANAMIIDHNWRGPDGQRYHAAWSPFVSQDAPQRWPAKWIGVLLPASTVRQMHWQAAVLPLLTGLVTATVVGVLAAWLMNRLVRRIERLQRQVQKIGTGDFQIDEACEPSDELGSLTKSVQWMANELRMMDHKIHEIERSRLLHSMATGLSHDLRNTLTGARLAIQLHARQEKAESSESIQVAIRQLRLAEEQLQRFMRLDGSDWRDTPAKLGDLLDQIREMLQPMIEHHRVTYRSEIGVELREHVVPFSEWLRSSLLNLVLNGIQAAGESGWVELKVTHRDGQLHFEVRDNGPGPAPEIATTMFEPMVTGKPEGVGLGLALVSKAAEHMQGEVGWLREDGYTTFLLIVPSTTSPQ